MMQVLPFAREHAENGNFPVAHLSYSAIKALVNDPRGFLRRYVRYEFDDKTGAAYLVGLAVHKALELRWKPDGDGMMVMCKTKDETVKDAVAAFDRLLLEVRTKALAKFRQEELTPFTRELEDAEVRSIHDRLMAETLADFLAAPGVAFPQGVPEWYEKLPSAEARQPHMVAALEALAVSLVKWGRDTPETCRESCERAVLNFLAAELPCGRVLATERSMKMHVTDAEGRNFPVPLKCVIDRLDETDAEELEVIDYKTASDFSDPEAEKGDFELQAGIAYLVTEASTGRAPARMRFQEILKDAPQLFCASQPERTKFLKSDLAELCEAHKLGVDKKDKVEDLKAKLVAAKVLVPGPGAKEFVIEYAERPDVVMAARAMIAGAINLAALYDQSGTWLPNLSNRYGGDESWADFKEAEAMSKEEADERARTAKEAARARAREAADLDTF